MTNLQKIGIILICLALLQGIFETNVALAQGGLPPRPSGAPGNSSGNGGGNGDSNSPSIILGDIYGQVFDRSTGEPGRGLTVMINDIPIKTDASGRFSLTGIADGTYQVDLALPVELAPAQPVQTVVIADRQRVDIELGFFSAPPAVPAENTPEPTLLSNQLPATMPETGGVTYPMGFIYYLLGILVWTLGTVQILQKVAP